MAGGVKSRDLGFRARSMVDFCERIGPQYVRQSWYFYKGLERPASHLDQEQWGEVQEILKEFVRRGLNPKGEEL